MSLKPKDIQKTMVVQMVERLILIENGNHEKNCGVNMLRRRNTQYHGDRWGIMYKMECE